MNHRFLEAVLSATGFRPDFHSLIYLLYATPDVVEMNGVRSSRSCCPDLFINVVRCCPNCIFLRRLRAYSVLGVITLPGPIILARYIAYADDVVTSNDKIDKVGKEIQIYETVTGTKIKICWLVVGSWKAPLSWTGDCCILLDVWLGRDLQMEKKWPEVLEKAVVNLWL